MYDPSNKHPCRRVNTCAHLGAPRSFAILSVSNSKWDLREQERGTNLKFKSALKDKYYNHSPAILK